MVAILFSDSTDKNDEADEKDDAVDDAKLDDPSDGGSPESLGNKTLLSCVSGIENMKFILL